MAPPHHPAPAAGAEVRILTPHGYRDAADAAAARALSEDLGGDGDLTGSAFAGDGRASVVAREAGCLSGTRPFVAAARQVDPRLAVELLRGDGQTFVRGETIVVVEGPVAAILAFERTGLNFLARLSGIATLTARYVAKAAGTRARIAATRKTTPGLRALEKQAVVHGGGVTHRFGLFDGALIKDNHVRAAGGVSAAVATVAAGLSHAHALEVEVESLDELREALAAGVRIVLLDNMSLDAVREAVAVVAGRATVEVSGGVRLGDVRGLAEAGVDIISVGALTTRAPWIDLSMDLEERHAARG